MRGRRRSVIQGVRRVAAPDAELPEPDLIGTAEFDPGAADGDDVATVTSGPYGWGTRTTITHNVITGAAVSPVRRMRWRTPGTNGAPVVRKRDGELQTMLYEFELRGGDQTSSGDIASRQELGLDTATRQDLILQYGDTYCFGGAFFFDPDNFVWEAISGQSLVWFQLPKGADSDPYFTAASDSGNKVTFRSSIHDMVLWDSGLTWATARGHLLRFMMRQYLHQTEGTIEWWWALDDDELVKQDLLNTDADADPKVWEGLTSWADGVTTTNGQTETTTSRRLRIGHYGDEPYGQASPFDSVSVLHRGWWTGLEVLKSTDPAHIWAVEPPTLEP